MVAPSSSLSSSATAATATDLLAPRRRRRRDILMSAPELNAVLSQPFFTLPMTVNLASYQYYRGRSQVKVLTLRFNLTPSFDERSMVRNVLNVLDEYFNLQTRILGSMRYDLVLCNQQSDPPTYYIWRANTNHAEFDENNEISINFTHANVLRFCQNAANVNIPDLNIYFDASNVVIDRCLAIVLSFVI